MSEHLACIVCGGQKRSLDVLELEINMVMKYHMGTGNLTSILHKSNNYFYCWAGSPAPFLHIFKYAYMVIIGTSKPAIIGQVRREKFSASSSCCFVEGQFLLPQGKFNFALKLYQLIWWGPFKSSSKIMPFIDSNHISKLHSHQPMDWH